MHKSYNLVTKEVKLWLSKLSHISHSNLNNILDPLTQETNQVGTSHQEAAPTGNGDIQTFQDSSEQTPSTASNQIQYNPGPLIQYVQ